MITNKLRNFYRKNLMADWYSQLSVFSREHNISSLALMLVFLYIPQVTFKKVTFRSKTLQLFFVSKFPENSTATPRGSWSAAQSPNGHQ